MVNNIVFLLLGLIVFSCSSGTAKDAKEKYDGAEQPSNGSGAMAEFFYGADLSYVNEMQDCGATYYNEEGQAMNPYQIFAQAGTNLVRLRLWHDPSWGEYSDFKDVRRSISIAKAQGLPVLLDFHYSDTWADPERQLVPKAWKAEVNNTAVLGDSLYHYTYKTLSKLGDMGLLPEMVQVGNETNAMILQDEMREGPIDWTRNAFLFNKGIEAVRDISKEYGKEVGIMLHIAQPENAIRWFKDAVANGVTDFDWIGISYYPLWSEYPLEELGGALSTLKDTYQKRVMIVETAYPYSMTNADTANNILGEEALLPGYPATPKGQYDYLIRLASIIKDAGGDGLVYWEPAWVSTECRTQWGQGSHWDNATLFDPQGKAHLGMQFYAEAKND